MDKTENPDLDTPTANTTAMETPTEAARPAPGTTPKTAAPETGKLQDDLAEMKDKYLRLLADYENLRKRTAKERLELIQTASEKVLKELLVVLDDFDRAEKSFRNKDDKEAEGFFLIQNKFKKVLEAQGVKPMDTSSGVFDPDLHDAITQIPAAGEDARGKIMEVVEKGYLLHDKVIRHAKVVIGS